MNLRQKLSGGAVILLGSLQAYLYMKGQPPPPALDQAFIAALGVLVAPKGEVKLNIPHGGKHAT